MLQTASWDNLLQLAADAFCIIIYSNCMAFSSQLPSSRQSSHTTTDNAYFLASLFLWCLNLLICTQPAEITNLNRFINSTTSTAIHTWIWAYTAAYRARERGILQLQIYSLLQLTLTDKIKSSLSRNSSRTVELAWCVIYCIVPAWNPQSVKTIFYSIMNSKIIHCNIGEDTALYPFLSTEILNTDFAILFLTLFFKGQWTKLLPLAPVSKLTLQLLVAYLVQELTHTAGQEVNIISVKIEIADICWICTYWPSYINYTAYHAYAGPFAQHGSKFLGIIATDHSTAAAHKLKGEGTSILQNPEFWLII